jgi:flavin reductase (DIM6/NTAB) family NADH-FMN oxidoreductase RutF
MCAALFKQGMRRLAASVAVITTRDEDEVVGLTATAVCSLSADPPSLLCCLNQRSRTAQAIGKSRQFAVNILSPNDIEVAGKFATSAVPAEKFAVGKWNVRPGASPWLSSATAVFECSVSEVIESGTHLIFIGHVMDVRLDAEDSTSLLYAHGEYGSFINAFMAEAA